MFTEIPLHRIKIRLVAHLEAENIIADPHPRPATRCRLELTYAGGISLRLPLARIIARAPAHWCPGRGGVSCDYCQTERGGFPMTTRTCATGALLQPSRSAVVRPRTNSPPKNTAGRLARRASLRRAAASPQAPKRLQRLGTDVTRRPTSIRRARPRAAGALGNLDPSHHHHPLSGSD